MTFNLHRGTNRDVAFTNADLHNDYDVHPSFYFSSSPGFRPIQTVRGQFLRCNTKLDWGKCETNMASSDMFTMFTMSSNLCHGQMVSTCHPKALGSLYEVKRTCFWLKTPDLH